MDTSRTDRNMTPLACPSVTYYSTHDASERRLGRLASRSVARWRRDTVHFASRNGCIVECQGHTDALTWHMRHMSDGAFEPCCNGEVIAKC